MDNQILNSYSKIPNLNVSRETCNELESLITMIQEKNKKINIISREIFEKDQIRERHIIDSAQIIDFVDLNCNTTCDIGTGGGMPGLIVAIVMKKIKNETTALVLVYLERVDSLTVFASSGSSFKSSCSIWFKISCSFLFNAICRF